MWLFIKNQGYNTQNYYKIEVTHSERTMLNIYDISDTGEMILKKSCDVLKKDKEEFVEYISQLLAETFIKIEDSRRTLWINKSFIKMIEVKPVNNKIILKIETINNVADSYNVADGYPEFNLFWLKNWKNNIADDTIVFVPTPESAKRGRKSKIEKVVNTF